LRYAYANQFGVTDGILEIRKGEKMNSGWSTEYLPDKQILLVEIRGIYAIEDAEKLVTKIAAMRLNPEQARILIDLRKANGEFDLLDIYNLPGTYESVYQALLFKVAFVFKQIGPDQLFHETVCYNKGFGRIRSFDDFDKAMNWLSSELFGKPDSAVP
jgi:hypothetical protein